MTLRHRFTLRSVSTTAALGLVATTAVVLGTPGAASAATISFDCTVPVLGPSVFTVDVTTDTPARVAAGSSVTPTITSRMSIPESQATTMRGLGVTAISGTVAATNLVDGTPVPTTITIPSTDIGSSGPAVVTGTGTLPAIAAGTAGTTHQIAAGSQDVSMKLIGMVGEPTFDIPCTVAPGQSSTISSFTATTSSSTAVKAKYAKAKRKATATATVSAAGVTPTGTVTFTLTKGAKQVKTMTATVVGGQAKATFKKLKKGRYTVTASYGGTPAATGSSGSAAFKVR